MFKFNIMPAMNTPMRVTKQTALPIDYIMS